MPLWCNRVEGRRAKVHSSLIPHPSSFIASARGFTLIELLVAMTIFSILAAIAVSAFRGTRDDDRIAAAAQQIKSALEGARSRAIHDKAPRGVRLLRDPNNPTLCNALQYIALAPSDESLLVDLSTPPDGQYVSRSAGGPDINKVVEYYTSFDFNSGAAPAATRNCVVPIGDAVATWKQLFTQGLLRAGTRIELPKGKGRWYVVANVVGLDTGNPQTSSLIGLQLSEPLETDNGTYVFPFPPSSSSGFPYPTGLPFLPAIPQPVVPNLEYSLDLGVAPLAGAEPVPLTKGVVIDLDASDIPDDWRPNPAFSGSGGAVDYPGDYPNIDILFASNGKMLGSAARAGVFHLYLGNLEEVDKYMQSNWTPNTPGSQRPITSGRTADIPGGASTPQKPTKIVTVLTASGQVYSSEVNFKGTTVVQKLQFAKSGKETP